jgi:carbonic anhydrase
VSAPQPADDDPFGDLLEANRQYAEEYGYVERAGVAAKGLAVLTCMDARLDPLRMLGLAPGDAKVLRNAGARVTDEVLRTLTVARHLLGVHRIMVVAHTGCRMSGSSEQEVHEAIRAAGGPDTRSITFLTASDQRAALTTDVQRVRSWPYLDGAVTTGGFLYDLTTGTLSRVC